VRMPAIALVGGLLLTSLGGCAYGPSIGSEAEMHPRIAQAISDLEDAISYMQSAPNNFGGHKAAAIAASQAAIQELRAALAFRAQQDAHY
jgi:hypothetical protein